MCTVPQAVAVDSQKRAVDFFEGPVNLIKMHLTLICHKFLICDMCRQWLWRNIAVGKCRPKQTKLLTIPVELNSCGQVVGDVTSAFQIGSCSSSVNWDGCCWRNTHCSSRNARRWCRTWFVEIVDFLEIDGANLHAHPICLALGKHAILPFNGDFVCSDGDCNWQHNAWWPDHLQGSQTQNGLQVATSSFAFLLSWTVPQARRWHCCWCTHTHTSRAQDISHNQLWPCSTHCSLVENDCQEWWSCQLEQVCQAECTARNFKPFREMNVLVECKESFMITLQVLPLSCMTMSHNINFVGCQCSFGTTLTQNKHFAWCSPGFCKSCKCVIVCTAFVLHIDFMHKTNKNWRIRLISCSVALAGY